MKKIKAIKQLKNIVADNTLYSVGDTVIEVYRDTDSRPHQLVSGNNFCWFGDDDIKFWLNNSIIEVEYEDDEIEILKRVRATLEIIEVWPLFNDDAVRVRKAILDLNRLIESKEKEGSK